MTTEKRKQQKAVVQKKYKETEKGKITQAKYYKSDAKKESNKRWREKNKIKIIAHRIVDKAKKQGLLFRMPCEVCGKPNAFAHHDDYSKPLDVKWFCNFHHTEHHRKLG